MPRYLAWLPTNFTARRPGPPRTGRAGGHPPAAHSAARSRGTVARHRAGCFWVVELDEHRIGSGAPGALKGRLDDLFLRDLTDGHDLTEVFP